MMGASVRVSATVQGAGGRNGVGLIRMRRGAGRHRNESRGSRRERNGNGQQYHKQNAQALHPPSICPERHGWL